MMSFDEYVESFRRRNIKVLAAGPSTSSWHIEQSEVTQDRVVLVGHVGSASIAAGTLPSSELGMILPVGGQDIRVNGRTLLASEVAILPPGRKFIFTSQAPTSYAAVFVREPHKVAWLEAACRLSAAHVYEAPCLASGDFFRIAAEERRERHLDPSLVDTVCSRLISETGWSTERPLLNVVLDILEDPLFATECRVERILKRVQVGDRSLLRAFHRFVGMPPKRFLLLRQLNRIRREIIWSMDGRKVTQLLLQCGASELGRVAGSYKALFGETPSETLRRVHPPRARRSNSDGSLTSDQNNRS